MAKKKKPIQHPEYEKAPMDRRTFFRQLAVVGGLAGGTGYVAYAPPNWPLSLRDADGLRSVPKRKPLTLDNYYVPKPGSVSADFGVARADRQYDGDGKALDFTSEQARNLLRAAIDQIGGIEHYIQKDDIVLVKPNVAFDRSPNLGATSNPQLLEELIRLVLGAGAQEVRVADNPIESAPDCFRKSKIDSATTNAGGRVYLPDSNAFRPLVTEGAALIPEWEFFYRPFTNVDKVIGISPVKDHNLCHASMGLKNWYGLLGGTRNQFHQDIHGIVSDFAIMIRPTFTILDGTNILMENGPTGGDPSNVRRGNVVVATLDQAASDAWAFEHCLERPAENLPAYVAKAVEKSRLNAKDGIPALNMDWRVPGRFKELHV